MADGSSCDTPLHIAAGCGDVEEVKRLLNSKQYEVDVRNSEQQTPLHLACANGQVGVVEILVSKFNATIDLVDSNKYMPLVLGAKNFQFRVVVALLCSIITQLKACLIQQCHVHILESFVSKLYHDPKAQEEAKKGFSFVNKSATTEPILIIILLVSIFGLNNLIIIIEENKERVKTAIFNENSILHLACIGGYIHVEKNTSGNVFGKSAINDGQPLSRSRGHLKMIDKLIVEYHLDPNARNTFGSTPLDLAAVYGLVDTAIHLITEYKVETDTCDNYNSSPVCLASQAGQFNLVKMLIEEFECCPSTKGYRERTLLHYACQSENLELIDLSIRDYKLSPMCKDIEGNTPLHIAALCGQIETVRHLITEYKVETDACNNENNSPVFLALLKGRFKLVKMLIEEFECCPSTQGFKEQTLLHYACESENLELIDLLTRYKNIENVML